MPKEFQIDIEGVIGWDTTPRDIRSKLAQAAGEPVRVRFDSPGGFTHPGIQIFNLIRNYQGKTIAVLSSLAASMSSYIPMAFDEIETEDNAIFMIHNVWGFAVGDHRNLRHRADIMEGTSKLLSNAYSERTGKDRDEILKMMDKETFFYGEEIVKAGFADRVISSSKKKTSREDAMTQARLAVDDCLALMKKETESTQEDFNQLVAFFGANRGLLEISSNTKPNTPSIHFNEENNKTEVSMSKLDDFLAQNPDVKSEYDARIAAAGTASQNTPSGTTGEPSGPEPGKEAGKDARATDASALFARVQPILVSSAYPEHIKSQAAKVINGTLTIDNFEAMVAQYDAVAELLKSKEAGAQSGVTPGVNGQQPGQSNYAQTGKIETAEDFKAAVDFLKEI